MKLFDKIKGLKNNWFSEVYINKAIIRFFFVLIIIMFAYAFSTGNITQKLHVKCDKYQGCNNPLYICETGESFSTDNCQPMYMNNAHRIICEEEGCPKKLEYGQELGEEMSSFGKNLKTYTLLLIFAAFGINHLYYMFRGKKE